MTTTAVDRASGSESAFRRAYRFMAPELQPTASAGQLRLGVERGVTVTLAIVALLMVLLSLPQFAEDHLTGRRILIALSLSLAGLMVAALPVALIQRAGPIRAGLWLPVAAFVGMLVIEPFTVRDPLPAGATPWLLGLSLIAFSCTAVAETDSVRAAAVCASINVALACVYAGRVPVSHSLVDLVGLGLLAAALVVGVRALRVRADQADLAEQQAQLLFEDHQRRVAMESERAATDAILHDTVLASLLATAGGGPADRSKAMAAAALEIVTSAGDHPHLQPPVIAFGDAVARTERELAPLGEWIDVDLAAAAAVTLPSDVGEAMLAGAIQAMTNSVRHAGDDAVRTAHAEPLADGGLRIRVVDDGAGFALGEVSEERLGVRVSILDRVRLAGASAEIRTAPGAGTEVTLEWHPITGSTPVTRRPAELLLNLIPRRRLYWIMGVVIVVAAVVATVEALLVTSAYSSVIASLLGLAILPTLLRGAREGHMSTRAAWSTAAVGIALCSIATVGLNPADFDCVTICRYTCGVLAGAVMGWMAGRRLTPVLTVVAIVVQITLWAGPTGAIRLGLAAEIVIVVAGLLVHRAIRGVSAAADLAAGRHHDLTVRQAELAAFDAERRRRLLETSRTAAPLLRKILVAHGRPDEASRLECRVLEQALRDEIRGRRLMNGPVRTVISEHRRRGALVQVLDDGGVEHIPQETLDALLTDVARRLAPVRSSRIVIRTGHPESDTAITVVASTPDETAAALGLDHDDEVDLWLSIPRPESVAAP